jgi:hypothetical protein
MLCDFVIDKESLPLKTENWGYNDGAGLETQEECDMLANALKPYVDKIKDDLYLCLGMWCTEQGQFLPKEDIEQLNSQFPVGTILYSTVVTKDGNLVQPSHSTNRHHLDEFIDFLKNSGGFEIC